MNIINDDDADPDEKTNAEERVAIRRNEIGQINARLEENLSLREKNKRNFPKIWRDDGVDISSRWRYNQGCCWSNH